MSKYNRFYNEEMSFTHSNSMMLPESSFIYCRSLILEGNGFF